MKSLLFVATLLAFTGQAMAHGQGEHKAAKVSKKSMNKDQKTFGGQISGKTSHSALSKVMGDFSKYDGKTIVLEATPEKVCEKKGCWMVLKDGKHKVRTLFKDYGFFVPANIVGKKVRVQGIMEQKKVSAGTIRHFMKDAGKSIDEIKKVKTSQIQFQFTADAVEII